LYCIKVSSEVDDAGQSRAPETGLLTLSRAKINREKLTGHIFFTAVRKAELNPTIDKTVRYIELVLYNRSKDHCGLPLGRDEE
jgi:hypothetical protein